MAGLFGALASGLRRPETKATDVSGLGWPSLFGQPQRRSNRVYRRALKVSAVSGISLDLVGPGPAEGPPEGGRHEGAGQGPSRRSAPISSAERVDDVVRVPAGHDVSCW